MFNIVPIAVIDCSGKVNINTTTIPAITLGGVSPPDECTNCGCIGLDRQLATTDNALVGAACASLAERNKIVLEFLVNIDPAKRFLALVLLNQSITASLCDILANGFVNGRKFVFDRHSLCKIALGEEHSHGVRRFSHSADEVLSYLKEYRSGNFHSHTLKAFEDVSGVVGVTKYLVELSCELTGSGLQEVSGSLHILAKNCSLYLTAKHKGLLIIAESIECLVDILISRIIVFKRMENFCNSNPLILIAEQIFGDVSAVSQEVENHSTLTAFQIAILGLTGKADVSIGQCSYKTEYVGCSAEILADCTCRLDRCFLDDEFADEGNILFERDFVRQVVGIICTILDDGGYIFLILCGKRSLACHKVLEDFH